MQKLITALIILLCCPVAFSESHRWNVLMVGDSITLHTRGVVSDELSGFVDVFGLPENGRYTGYALDNWSGWLDNLRYIEPSEDTNGDDGNPNEKSLRIFSAVVIGHGLWDIARVVNGNYRTPLNSYLENIEILIDRARAINGNYGEAPTVVVSAITPVPAELDNVSSNSDVISYNEALIGIVAERRALGQSVVYNNLYSKATPILQEHQLPGDVHFTEIGYAVLGNATAQVVRASLLDKEPQRLPVVSCTGILLLCFTFCALNRVWRMI